MKSVCKTVLAARTSEQGSEEARMGPTCRSSQCVEHEVELGQGGRIATKLTGRHPP